MNLSNFEYVIINNIKIKCFDRVNANINSCIFYQDPDVLDFFTSCWCLCHTGPFFTLNRFCDGCVFRNLNNFKTYIIRINRELK